MVYSFEVTRSIDIIKQHNILGNSLEIKIQRRDQSSKSPLILKILYLLAVLDFKKCCVGKGPILMEKWGVVLGPFDLVQELIR